MAGRGMRVKSTTPALIAAAKDGNLPMVMQLVNQGHSLNVKDENGLTPLYWACCRGHNEMSKFLINAGSDINARANWGATVLLAATDNGHEMCVRYLLKRNVDVNAANHRGDTPLHAAAYRGYVNILRLLAEAGANPFMKNSTSMTALQEAVAQQQHQCVICLQQYMGIHSGFSGSMSLSSPNLSLISLYEPSKEDTCKSWPYVAPSNILKVSQDVRQEQRYSLSLDKPDSNSDNDVLSPRYLQSKPSSYKNTSYSKLSLDSEKHLNTESQKKEPIHQTISKENLNIYNSSFPELTVEGVNESSNYSLPMLSHVLNYQNPQIQHRKSSRFSPSDNEIINIETLELTRDTKVIDESETRDKNLQSTQNHINSSTQWSIEKEQPTLFSSHTLTSLVNDKTQSTERSLFQSDNTKHACENVLQGVNIDQFVHDLQIRMVQLQEKVILSNSLIAQLEYKILEGEKEKAELKAENDKLRSLLYNQYPFSLRTFGISDCSTHMKNGSSFLGPPQSMAYIIRKDEYYSSDKSRCPVESSDNEGNPF